MDAVRLIVSEREMDSCDVETFISGGDMAVLLKCLLSRP